MFEYLEYNFCSFWETNTPIGQSFYNKNEFCSAYKPLSKPHVG